LTELARPNTIGFGYHFGDQPFGRVMTSGTGAAAWVPIPTIARRTTTARLRASQFACTVTTMNFSRLTSSVGFAGCAASFVMALGVSASVAGPASASPLPAPETPATVSACPTAAPPNGGTPEWALPGTTGSVAVTGSTDETAPLVKVEAPFSAAETQVHTLQAGDGPVVANTATVSVCYMGVNGRDGTVFDSSYARGVPAQFSLNGVVPGFQKAIAGQKVGSTVAVAMAPADGYPDGQPSAGIQKGDSLIFAIKILGAST
jgi:FKBP-type peptidyl-prolyl cis-trans isomerase